MKTISPKPMNEDARAQCETILSLMGPYSISLFIKAIEQGKINGCAYSNTDDSAIDDGLYIREETQERISIEEFEGCMLGWAGFLENLSIMSIWRVVGGPQATGDIEYYIKNITPGFTPENHKHVAGLYAVVCEFQAAQKSQKVEAE